MAKTRVFLIFFIGLYILCNCTILASNQDCSEKDLDYFKFFNCSEYRTLKNRVYDIFYNICSLKVTRCRRSLNEAKIIHFYVISESDAHLYLSETASFSKDDGFELVIGAASNQLCIIRRGAIIDLKIRERPTPNLLKLRKVSEVYIEIYKDNFIEITVDNVHALAAHIPEFYHSVNYFSFGTNQGLFNHYLFNCSTDDSTSTGDHSYCRACSTPVE